MKTILTHRPSRILTPLVFILAAVAFRMAAQSPAPAAAIAQPEAGASVAIEPAAPNVTPAPPAKARTGRRPSAAPAQEPGALPSVAFGNAGESFGGAYGGGFGVAGGNGGTGVYTVRNTRETVPPVVIQFSNPDPAALQDMEEDLTIMSHVLDQALERGLGEEAPPSKMGVPLLYTASGRSIRALYLDGFGAVIMIKVNMPLMGSSAADGVPSAKGAAESEWESARREVLGLSDGRRQFFNVSAPAADMAFEPEQVESLKQTLIAALKNASHIRGLKSDDWVSLAVFGQRAAQDGAAANVHVQFSNTETDDTADQSKPSSTSGKHSKANRKVSSTNSNSLKASNGTAAALNPQTGTVLSLRVKAGVITAFAEDKLSLADFTKKVAITTYAGNGYGVTSVNSWIQSGRAR